MHVCMPHRMPAFVHVHVQHIHTCTGRVLAFQAYDLNIRVQTAAYDHSLDV